MPSSPRSYFVLPSHGLEDFPTHLHGTEAENLLSTWSTLWHPALLTATNRSPVYLRAGIDVITQQKAILFVPLVANSLLNESFYQSVDQNQAILIQSQPGTVLTRAEMLASTFDSNPEIGQLAESVDPEVAADFFALAFAYLQVQLMTRQLRYSSNLDQEQFDIHLLEAAQAAVKANPDTTNSKLSRCFELLLEEKNCYYPIEPQLLDMVLVTSETLGNSLDRQLEWGHRISVAMTAGTASRMAQQNPIATSIIRKRLEEGQLCLAGGLQQELPWSLLSSESEINQLLTGQAHLNHLFDDQASIFFQQQLGLHANLPTILDQLQFSGAIHATLDGRGLPLSSAVDMRWSATDGSCLSAYGYRLLNASDAGSLIGLGRQIGEQIDSTHTATILFAHWPNQYCEAFNDLLRCQKFHPVLGQWKSLQDYFQSVYDAGYGDQFEPNDYQFPFHLQATEQGHENPISRCIYYWQTHFQILNWQGIVAQFSLDPHSQRSDDSQLSQPIIDLVDCLGKLQTHRDRLLDFSQPLDTIVADIASWQDSARATIKVAFESLFKPVKTANHLTPAPLQPSNEALPTSPELLIANSLNFKRTARIKSFPLDSGQVLKELPVQFMDSNPTESIWVLQLPGASRATINLSERVVKRQKSPPSMIDKLTLRNEFFEAEIDEESGGIRSISPYDFRRSVVSQRLAMRTPKRTQPENRSRAANYSKMICDEIQFPEATSIEASIVTCGRLLDDNQPLAKFKQTMTMTRGIPWIEIDMELQLIVPLEQSPYHYVCNRVAWRNEAAQLSGNFQEIHHRVSTEWFYCPLFYRLDDAQHSITVLTGGLPYHRRVGRRMIDSLLMTCNEQRKRFRLAIGLGIDYPLLAAANWMTEPIMLPVSHGDPTHVDPKWFIHFDRKNILVTCWQPVLDDGGKVSALRFRCRETEGRAGELTIRLNHPVASATRVDFLGNFQRTLRSSESNQFQINFHSYEFFQIELKL